MTLTYAEEKESVLDFYESFHLRMGDDYSIEQTLHVAVGEARYDENFSQTIECCIYLTYAILLLEKGHDIGFMTERLSSLLEERHFEYYKSELRDEYDDFLKDVAHLKGRLQLVAGV